MKSIQGPGHITHAVIGAQETINFGISTDPAFFQILSSSLYKNPILAVVRETLCNAWDAHIDAGATNLPIQILMEEDHLIIRDFGKGIPHSMIGPIYGMYGGSTKKTDNRQTGSFGLGCKSPFAYVEHFEVTSWNQGIKSIYVISRSSASTTGTPGITRLINVPTDQTGLQVKIRIKQDDANKFIQYIQDIVSLGGIKATLNHSQISTIPLDTVPGSWTLIEHRLVPYDLRTCRVFVRYGTVVYPVDNHPSYAKAYDKLISFARFHFEQQAILVQAEPNTLAVMPNRESLSMQEETCAGLTKLVKQLQIRFQGEVRPAIIANAKTKIDEAVRQGDLNALLNLDTLPGLRRNYDRGMVVSVDRTKTVAENIAEHYVHYAFRPGVSPKKFHRPILEYRIKQIQNMNVLDPGLVQSFFRTYTLKKRLRTRLSNQQHWYQQYVLTPIAKSLYAEGLSTASLHVVNQREYDSYAYRRRYRHSKGFSNSILVPIKGSIHRMVDRGDLTNTLYKTIFLASSKKNFENHYMDYLTYRKVNTKDWLCYILPAQKTLWPVVHKAFARIGYTVVDLTVQQDWMPEQLPEPEPIFPKEKAPKIEGRRTLLSYYDKNKMIQKNHPEADVSKRITKYAYYAYIKRGRQNYDPDRIEDMPNLRFSLVQPIAELGIGVESMNTVAMLRKQGIPSLAEYVITSITNHIQTSPTIIEWKKFSLADHLGTNGLSVEMVEFIENYEPAKKHYGLVHELTDDDKYALQWLSYYRKDGLTYRDRIQYLDGKPRTLLQDTETYLKNIQPDPNLKKIVEQIKKASQILEILNFSMIHKILIPGPNDKVDSAVQAKIHAVVMAAL